MASSFFFMLEVDRVHLQQSRREATKLRKGYQGLAASDFTLIYGTRHLEVPNASSLQN